MGHGGHLFDPLKVPDLSMKKIAIRFTILVYPSEFDDIGAFTAHCLNLDIIADDDTVEGAIGNLLEAIETHIDAAEEHGAHVLFHPAPDQYWKLRGTASELAPELNDRIVRNANKRLGHTADPIDVKEQCEIKQAEPALA